jgi:hypothetical protein
VFDGDDSNFRDFIIVNPQKFRRRNAGKATILTFLEKTEKPK